MSHIRAQIGKLPSAEPLGQGHSASNNDSLSGLVAGERARKLLVSPKVSDLITTELFSSHV